MAIPAILLLIAADAQAQHRVMGVATCAAANCHGGDSQATGVHGAEYTIWISQDPHAKAYSTLFSARSQEMARRLWPGEKRSAHKQAECLACHSLEHSPGRIFPGREAAVEADGVSCEACHGPAEHWLAAHSQIDFRNVGRTWESPPRLDAFQARFRESEELQKKTGLANTDNLKTRGEQCLRCHVGPSDGHDVNHDLIAAGHPRLAFEYASYLSHLPTHWNTQAEKAVQPDLTPRAWALGQFLTAEASLKLLAHRVDRAAKDGPWPEFAEYDCFACHHDLGQDTRRQNPSTGHNRWGAWTSTLLPMVSDSESVFSSIRTEMERDVPRRAELPDRFSIPVRRDGVSAASWQRELARLNNDADRGGAPLGDARIRKLRTAILKKAIEPGTMSWDEWAQCYLAVAALSDLKSEISNPKSEDATLAALRRQLMFPKSFESPQGFDPAKVRKLFEDLQSQGGP